ncbi:hypothetical protein CLIB1423_21S00276 [[Candida] railenensis]|uniref:Uncharacterized protein n=1 Tax=[Candida] railenensis TaxID=45579 RepID=A0A9P0QUU8_9ASCO|nr:hypothetical protein CLIB1423_21S00276 [[Candida] railenensis]
MQRSRSLRSNQSVDRARSSSAIQTRSSHTQEPLIQAVMHHQHQHQHQHPHSGASRGNNLLLTRSISSNTVYHDGVIPRNKNIPMVDSLKRWNTSNSHDNITKMKTDGLYDSSSSKKSLRHSENTPLSSVAHDSMHSLVPMEAYHAKNVIYHQSESDASDEETYMFIPTVDNSTKGSSISNSMGAIGAVGDVDVGDGATSAGNTVNDIQDAMNEISEFQNNFVQKYNSEVASPDAVPISRVQKKILDYKELRQYNSPGESGSVNSLDYNMKIQNETLNSQYTLIRLRFNSGNKVGVLGFLNERKWEPSEMNENQISKVDKDKYLDELWRSEMKAFKNMSFSSTSRSNSRSSFDENGANSTMYTTANSSSVNFPVGTSDSYGNSNNSKMQQHFDISMGESHNNSMEEKENSNINLHVNVNEDEEAPMQKSNSSLSEMAKNIHFNNIKGTEDDN